MDPMTIDSIVLFLAAVVIPLIVLGLFANRLGADSRELYRDSSSPTPWSW
jgi:hypothetical protein